jgi:uncharacterized protein YcnI
MTGRPVHALGKLPPALLAAALLAAVLGGAGAFTVAAPAAAHVTVSPVVAAPGDVVEFTVAVQNEREDVGSARLEVALPAGTPITEIDAAPHPGWTFSKVTTASGATRAGDAGITRLRWSADTPQDRTPPGATDRFTVRLGPLPDADELVLKALQTYGDGEVVRWTQLADGSAEPPERPAPVVLLGGASRTAVSPASPSASAAGSGWARSRAAAGGAIVLGGLLVLAMTLVRRRRT